MLATDASVLFIYFGGTPVPIWRACDIWNKEGGEIPSFWGTLNGVWDQPQHGHLHNLQLADTHRLAVRHIHTDTNFLPFFPFFFWLLSLLSLSFQVVLEYLRCAIRHWFPSEPEGKKEILDRKVYKKRTLWIFDILRTAASKWVGWRGKEKQLQVRFFLVFICCLFSLSSFREMEASTRPQLIHPYTHRLSAGPWKRNWHS